MENQQVVTLTADIVSAHVSNNSVAVGDLPGLIQQVHSALAALGQPGEAQQQKREPAVSARASVKPDYIVCMVCGKKQKTLKRHLQTAHDMTPQEYRQEFGLSADYPMTAPSYSERRSAMAKEIGLGTKGKSGRGKGRAGGRGRGRPKKSNDGSAPAGK